MPILRMAPDNSLAETLGNLGQSLGNAMDPMRKMQAYELQQRMFLQQETLRQQQRKDQAIYDTVRNYAHLVPPDKLPQIAAMVYQNAPIDQIQRAVAFASGRLRDEDTPEALQANIEFMRQINPSYNYATDGPPVAGAVTKSVFDKWKVDQAGKTSGAQKSAEISAEQAGRAPLQGMIDEDTPEADAKNRQIYQQVYGKLPDNGLVDAGPVTAAANRARLAVQKGMEANQTTTGTAQAKIDLAKNYIDEDTPEARANNTVIYTAINGQAPPAGLPVPIGKVTSDAYQRALAAQKQAEAEASARGTRAGAGVSLDKAVQDPPLPPAQSPALQPAPGSPPAPPVSPPVAQGPAGSKPYPGRPGWFIQGGRVYPPFNQGGVVGYNPGDIDTAKNENAANDKELRDAFGGAESAAKLRTITGQIRALAEVSQTGGAWGGMTAALQSKLRAVGLGNITTAQQAQEAEDNLLKTLIPALKNDYNLTRVAQPEIALLGTVTGSANMAPGVLNNVLANLDNGANYLDKESQAAGRVLGYDPSQQQSDYVEFQQTKRALWDAYQKDAEARRTAYGAVGAQPAPPVVAPVQPPVSNGPQPPVSVVPPQQPQAPNFLDFFKNLFGGGGGGASTEVKPNPDGSYPDAPPRVQ